MTARALARTDPAAGRRSISSSLARPVRWRRGARLWRPGGVYLGGGIAPRIVDVLAAGPFRAAFEDKGRLRPYVASIPVYVITAPDAGLRGAAVTLAADAQAVDRLS